MIITRIIPFPNAACRAFTALDIDGNYNVYINDALSAEAQAEAYRHEISHIESGDFAGDDVQEIEHRAHSA